MSTTIGFIPTRQRLVLYDTYANIAAMGAPNISVGDLGYATDTTRLYRYNGAAWQAITTITTAIISGLLADLPGATRFADNVVFVPTDEAPPADKRVNELGVWVLYQDAAIFRYPPDATLGDFQGITPTGTCVGFLNSNDGDVGTIATFTLNEFAEYDFGCEVRIDQWRDYGNASNNEDGHFKIQYYGLDLAYHDWATGIATRGASWRALQAAAEVYCTKVRMLCTLEDSGVSDSALGELEVYHS